MYEKLENKFEQETIDSVVNAAYGSCSIFDRVKVWFLIKKHAELNELYNDYRSTANSVHSMWTEEVPTYVLDKVESVTGVTITGNKDGFFSDLTSILFAKPQLVFIATAIVIGVLLTSVFFKEPVQENNYSSVEIELANKQAREALMLVSKIFNSTQATITEEIIPNRVVKPINESLGYINDLFKKGDI
jgi:hypothetical protein